MFLSVKLIIFIILLTTLRHNRSTCLPLGKNGSCLMFYAVFFVDLLTVIFHWFWSFFLNHIWKTSTLCLLWISEWEKASHALYLASSIKIRTLKIITFWTDYISRSAQVQPLRSFHSDFICSNGYQLVIVITGTSVNLFNQ